MVAVFAVVKVAIVVHHQTAPNSGSATFVLVHSTTQVILTAHKATVMTVGMQIFAKVCAHHARQQCVEENSRLDVKITAVATAEATVLVSL